jgi:hypothetical protein
MSLAEYLDSIANTEQEQQFLLKLSELKEEFGQIAKTPFVGKLFRALVVLGDSESIEEFKQSEHYENIKGFDIRVKNLEKGHFNIYPGKAQRKAMVKLSAVVAIGLLLIIFLRKKKRCKCAQ